MRISSFRRPTIVLLDEVNDFTRPVQEPTLTARKVVGAVEGQTAPEMPRFRESPWRGLLLASLVRRWADEDKARHLAIVGRES